MSTPTAESTIRNSEMEHTFRQTLRFLHAIWRRKHIVIAAVLVSAIFGGLKVSSIEPEPTTYESSGSVLLHQINPDQRGNSLVGGGAPVDAFREILLSGTVIEAAIAKLDKTPPELDSSIPKEQWPTQLRRILTVNAGRNSAIHLRCVSLAPETPAAVINAMIAASQEFLDRTQINMSVAMVDSLDKERLALEEKLFTKERDLFSAQQAIGGLSVGRDETDKHPLVERTLALNKSYLEAQSRRVSMQAALAAIEETLKTGSDLTPHLKPLADLLGDERLKSIGQSTDEEVTTTIRQEIVDAQRKLAESRSFYGPNHPRMIKLTQSLHQNQLYLAYAQAQKSAQWSSLKDPAIASQIHTLVKDAVSVEQQRENAIRQIYDEAEKEAIQLNGQLAEIEIARREVDLLREMHTMVLTRLTGINVNRDGASMKLFVMDRPPLLGKKVPQASTAKILPLFIFAGLLAGITIVYIIDTLDDRFRSPEELKQQLGLEVLGVISNIPDQSGVGIDALLVHSTPNAVESEAFRSLRTAIVFADEERQRLAITSSEPHDGKTTVLGNLAVTYAMSGKRTLIIDADLRSPGLTRMFNMRGLKGLSRILKSADPIAESAPESIRETGLEYLDILPCGPKPSNPSELLSSPRMSELVAWADDNYDQILIDCPPILAASDASIVGRLVDGLALVVQPKKNRRKLVLRAAEVLKTSGVDIAGVIANRIGGSRDGYGYGYGNGYGYGYGYGDDDHDGKPTESTGSASQKSRSTTNSNEASRRAA